MFLDTGKAATAVWTSVEHVVKEIPGQVGKNGENNLSMFSVI